MTDMPQWLLPRTIPVFIERRRVLHTPWQKEKDEEVEKAKQRLKEVRNRRIPKL